MSLQNRLRAMPLGPDADAFEPTASETQRFAFGSADYVRQGLRLGSTSGGGGLGVFRRH